MLNLQHEIKHLVSDENEDKFGSAKPVELPKADSFIECENQKQGVECKRKCPDVCGLVGIGYAWGDMDDSPKENRHI